MKIITSENSKPLYYQQRLYAAAVAALAATSNPDRIKAILGVNFDIWSESIAGDDDELSSTVLRLTPGSP